MNQLITTQQNQLTSLTPLEIAGQVANKHAETAVFADYLSRKSENTIKTQAAALVLFAEFLTEASIPNVTADCLQHAPDCWRGVTWGIVESFVKWMLAEGFSIATINNRLSAVKVYAKLATKAGVIAPQDLALLKTVSGYAGREAKRVNERRDRQRVGYKKAEHVKIDASDAKDFTSWETYADNSQGRRDWLLMCLLLDHGLRVGEVAGLKVSNFDLKAGELTFYRPKVHKTQTHELTSKTYQAAVAYFQHDAPANGRALLGSRKGGVLTDRPMSERGITKRVAYLGMKFADLWREKEVRVTRTPAGWVTKTVRVGSLSAHDCRHYWATDAARNGTDPFRLQEAGGWSSLVMPRRYVEDAKIANKGVRLSQ